jgi:cytoskeleton protein RodZ
MTSERTEQSATSNQHHGHPGATLASQREAMGWTVEQAAEQLKLAVRQVVAIEAGDYAALPSPAVTRGFVRAYAKILRLDPAPLVAMIPMDNPLPEESGGAAMRASRPTSRPTSFSHSRYPTHGKRSSLPLAWIAGVVVIAAAAGAAWHFGLVSLPGSQPAANRDAVLTAPADTASVTAPAADTVQNPTVPLISVPGPADAGASAAPAAGAASGAATTPAATAPGAAATAAPATAAVTTPAVTTPDAAAPAAAGANTLVLNVREDSWIEVKPQGGKALISRLVRAGSTETFDLPGTATLVVGNPGAVSATLRGAAVALPPVPGKTISRVTLK